MLDKLLGLLFIVVMVFLLHGCGGNAAIQDGPPHQAVSQATIERTPDATPRIEKPNPANQKPYTVFNKTYYPLKSSEGFIQRGTASWYGKKFHGQRTANGEVYDMYAMTAAHKQLPLPSYVQVHNLNNGRKVIVRVNDRGPFVGNRIIDLSYVAARKLGFVKYGTAQVEIKAITPNKTEANPEQATQEIYIQIAAFRNLANAQRIYDKLRHKIAYPLHWQIIQTELGKLYRIQAGPLPSEQVAKQLRSRIAHFKPFAR